MNQYDELGLENLAGGAASELFQRELKRVLKNIVDPNTEAKDVRKITLTVTFQPDETRETSGLALKCEAKLAGVKPRGSRMYIADGEDGPVGLHHNLKQQELFPAEKPNVIPLKEEKAND